MERNKRKWTAAVLTVIFVMCAGMPALGLAAEEPSYVTYDNEGMPITGDALLTELGFGATENRISTLLADGVPLSPGDLAATGQTLELKNPEGTVIDRFDVVLIGDVTGTGMAGEDQVSRIAAAINGTAPLEGIWAVAADINGSGRPDVQDVTAAAAEAAAIDAPLPARTERTLPTYVTYPDAEELFPAQISLSYLDGQMDIPYIRSDDAAAIFGTMVESQLEGELTRSQTEDGMISVWQRENGSTVEINFQSGQIWFSNISALMFRRDAGTAIDMVQPSTEMTFELTENSFNREGRSIIVDTADYGLTLFHEDGFGYMPLQTFSDLFMSLVMCSVVANDNGCFLLISGNLGAAADEYYSVEPGPRSPELAQFSYQELCLALDVYYGLKESHDISSFNTFFEQTGLTAKLLSEDPVTADKAIYELTRGLIGDLHSGFRVPSFYSGKDADCVSTSSPSWLEMMAGMAHLKELRSQAFPDGVPAYQEVGNTAYITFDNFEADIAEYTSENLPNADDSSLSTLGLLRYAQSQIRREDSPIEKVVIDLSCNGGGTADAAVATVGWFLGEAPISTTFTTNGTQSTSIYQVDLNGDGVFTLEEDTVQDLEHYCLVSQNSFSCGNLVPAVFKESRDVTLVGKHTRGGSNSVYYLTTASGTVFAISGPVQISTLSNGSYYSVDQGVEPDVPITIDSHFYDRELLSQQFNSMLR